MDNDGITMILTIVLITMIVIVAIMAIVYLRLLSKDKKRKKEEQKYAEQESPEQNKPKQPSEEQPEIGSILDFMEFETVEDNMIIKKERQKYLMVIECQGVNYDLMSGVEKNSVEKGFLQFLNTLRHPIQIYVQTRAINLENTIERYKQYLQNVENTYFARKQEYQEIQSNPKISDEVKAQKFFELTKSSNLYEYGKDIIKDTERMSLNNNILNKKYYIVISYLYENQGGDLKYTKEEIRNMAFSDLYTKAQSIIRTLTACGVKGRILDSIQLIELLYMAYNRDGAESYGIERALRASYDKLYSTAPDVFTKRLKELDKEIEKQATARAKQEIARARTQKEKEIEKREQQKEQLIEDMAKIILQQNKRYLGKDIVDRAMNNIENDKKQEGGEINEEKEETTTTGK